MMRTSPAVTAGGAAFGASPDLGRDTRAGAHAGDVRAVVEGMREAM
jgi:hypothetical protein